MSKSANNLSIRTRLGFSFGHVINDLSGSFWFSYSLLIFKLHLPATFAGLIVSLGQGTDAISTLATGYISTRKSHHLVQKYGQLKFYHLVGSVLTTLSFPFVYYKCIGCEESSDWLKFAYFFFFVIFFQVGWACVQVSHVALISKLAGTTADRVTLNSYRQAANVACSIVVYGVTFALLKSKGTSRTLTKDDCGTFTTVSLIIWATGALFAGLFHLMVNENASYEKALEVKSSESSSNDESCAKKQIDEKKWQDWLKDEMFYKIGLLYVVAHLYYILTQMYMPLLLQYTLKSPKESIALVPFVTYTAGFVSSFAIKRLAFRFGSKYVLFIGCAFAITFGVWVFFSNEQFGRSWQVYVACACNGVAGTSLLIAILSLISDLTCDHPNSGAFVFGVMSFSDKVVNGLSIFLLESCLPEPGEGDNLFYKTTIVSITGGCIVLVLMASLSVLRGTKVREDDKSEKFCTKL